MKIDKVIVSSNNDEKYLTFWPIIKKAWNAIGIEPLLIFTDKNPTDICSNKDVVYFNTGELNPGFVARNIRVLYPALFQNKVCLLSDIDMIPLDKNYFSNRIKDISNDDFLMFRNNLTTESQIPICWNAAKGKVWGDIFNVSNEQDINNLLYKWYEKSKVNKDDEWYNDQIMLKKYITSYEKNNGKILKIDDTITEFRRLDRSNYSNALISIFKNERFTDFHMPTPYKKNRILIQLIYRHYLKDEGKSILSKLFLLFFIVLKRFAKIFQLNKVDT